jgi:protein Mpv17
MSLLRGGTIKDALEELEAKFIPTAKANLYIWPLAQLINFRIMPLHYQILYMNFIGVFWNAYMSYVMFDVKAKDIE